MGLLLLQDLPGLLAAALVALTLLRLPTLCALLRRCWQQQKERQQEQGGQREEEEDEDPGFNYGLLSLR